MARAAKKPAKKGPANQPAKKGPANQPAKKGAASQAAKRPAQAASHGGKARAAKRAAPKRAAGKAKAAPKRAASKAKATPKRAAGSAKATPKRRKAPVEVNTPVESKAPAKQAARVEPTPPAAMSAPPAISEPMPSDAIPQPIGLESSSGRAPRSLSARERAVRSLPVVEILDDPHPIGALRRFLDSIKGDATPQQAQIALGAAQLMLLPIAREHRGGSEVKELVDLVLSHWDQFGERRKGFHAQEFLKHAFMAIGVDRERIRRLEDLVPESPSSDLLHSLACAHAVARDKVAMLRAVERALDAGASPTQFRRDVDFFVYANDPDFSVLLARAEVPPIPVDVDPHVPGVRAALDRLVATLKEFGEAIELRPPVRLDAILDAERARKISLPNDYRALLTITNGMTLWEHVFFAAGDYREPTPLALAASHYLHAAATEGVQGVEQCVPIAKWGSETDWLLYDPRGRLRAGTVGYVLRLAGVDHPIEDLAAALARIEEMARDTLGTN